MTGTARVVYRSAKWLLAAGALAVLLVAAWAVTKWWEYEREEPLRNGVAEIKAGNYLKARNLIEPFARRGNPHAALLMGQIHAFGLGVPADPLRAGIWFRISECKCTGPGEAELDTALDMARGLAGRKDAKMAGEWLAQAASAGNRSAQQLISDEHRLRSQGFEVPEDTSSFWRQFISSTEANSPPSTSASDR